MLPDERSAVEGALSGSWTRRQCGRAGPSPWSGRGEPGDDASVEAGEGEAGNVRCGRDGEGVVFDGGAGQVCGARRSRGWRQSKDGAEAADVCEGVAEVESRGLRCGEVEVRQGDKR